MGTPFVLPSKITFWVSSWKVIEKKPWKIYSLSRAAWLLTPLYSSRTSLNSKFAVGIYACTSGEINRRSPLILCFSFIMIECWQSLRRMFSLSKWKVYYEYWNAIWVPDVHIGTEEENEAVWEPVIQCSLHGSCLTVACLSGSEEGTFLCWEALLLKWRLSPHSGVMWLCSLMTCCGWNILYALRFLFFPESWMYWSVPDSSL